MNFDHRALIHVTIFLCLFLALLFIFRKKRKPHLNLSTLPSFNSKKTLKETIAKYSHALLFVALTAYLIAYLNPHYYKKKENIPETSQEGLAIYLVLDVSLSMLGKITQFSEKEWKQITKLDYLKSITSKVIKGDESVKGLSHDLLGIVTFARSAHILAPLTLDHQAILNHLAKLEVKQDENEKGTVLGYAIFKTSNLIEATKHFAKSKNTSEKASYAIKNSIIILITDGFQEVNPLDYNNPLRSIELIDAMTYAKNLGIHVYIVNIDPQIALDQYADFRKFFNLLTKSTGGDFFYVNDLQDLNKIYVEIDKIERSFISNRLDKITPETHDNIRLFFYPLSFGFILIIVYILLETLFLRRFP